MQGVTKGWVGCLCVATSASCVGIVVPGSGRDAEALAMLAPIANFPVCISFLSIPHQLK